MYSFKFSFSFKFNIRDRRHIEFETETEFEFEKSSHFLLPTPNFLLFHHTRTMQNRELTTIGLRYIFGRKSSSRISVSD